MAIGGGTFITNNKTIQGAYINFVSAAKAAAELSERGVAAVPVELDWGVENEVFKLQNTEFEKSAQEVFGYDFMSEKLKGIRDLFKNARTVYFYRINSGNKASNDYGTAKYSGVRGNDLKTVITQNEEDAEKFNVITYLENRKVDEQTVRTAGELKESKYVIPKQEAELVLTAGADYMGGSNAEKINADLYQGFLDKMESYSFHVLCCPSDSKEVKTLFAAFTKRMREDMGIKFQTVLHSFGGNHEGIINVKNTISDENEKAYSLVYWVSGAAAGCAVNSSITNKVYNGEFHINAEFKQSELEAAVKNGEFVFHKAGAEVRVLDDINSFTAITAEKNEDFQSNQVIRVLDQIANDIAVMFQTKYLGKIQNNEAGRISFWNDLVTYGKNLEKLNAIEDFSSEDVIVEKGNDKKSVVVSYDITPVCAMTKLYMTVMVM